MGQTPSSLCASIDSDENKKREAEDALTSMSLLAELKETAFFADVHYESSIEGDVLLPLDKVVEKGSATYVNVSAERDGVGKELDGALGHLLRADLVCFGLWCCSLGWRLTQTGRRRYDNHLPRARQRHGRGG